jgi:predicted ATPase
MIFEDAHWGDPSSLELFGRLVDRIEHLKVLLIVTFRAEFKAPWVGRPHVSTMLLSRMTKRQIDVMVQRVVAGSRLTESMRWDIVERADGVPLFAEEIAKAALESESEGLAAQTIAAIPSSRQAVPASLHASLMARLDRLGPAKEIAQMGAAIGREFSHALLVAAAGKSEPELEASLDHLVQAGLLFRHGEPPHAVYLFKHALVQDAAYGTLLREPRRALHSRIAEAMESQFPDVAATQPELLAHHCAAAGLTEKAAILWGNASKQSLARSALAEAEAQFTRALALIGSLPGTPALRREQFDLQVGLANAQMHTKGYASVETKASFDKARSLIHDGELLGESVEDPLAAVSVLYGFWVGNFMAFNGTAMRELSDQLLVIAKAQAQAAPLILCTRLVGLSRLLTGDITQGLSYLNQSFVYYNPIEHLPYASRFG